MRLVISPSLKNAGFDLVAANSSAVSTLGERAISIATISQLSVVLPFSVFVVNGSKNAAIATTVVFQVAEKTVCSQALRVARVSQSGRNGDVGPSCDGQSPLHYSGNSVTKQFLGSSVSSFLAAEIDERPSKVTSFLNDSLGVTIILDSVVLGDGLLIGPDKSTCLDVSTTGCKPNATS